MRLINHLNFSTRTCQTYLQIMERSLILLRLLGILSYNWRLFMSELCFILTKHSQIVCLINTIQRGYKLWNAFWFYCVFWIFSYIINDHSYLNCCISTNLSQIVCLMHTQISDISTCQMWKVPLCNQLWLRQYGFYVTFLV